MTITVDGTAVVRSVAAAEGYIARVCFKTGPPQRFGVELEWTVHHVDDPSRPLNVSALRAALGPHAPHTLDPTSPMSPLPGGSLVTVEPGGQVELSTPPAMSLTSLRRGVEADIDELTRLLATQGIRRSHRGIDPYRQPAQVIHTPRYTALSHAFEPYRPHGQVMMGSTAGLQVCVDAGTPDQVAQRWRVLHSVGPALLAAFANARHHAGRDTGWASARMGAWLGLDHRRTGPVWRAGEPSDAAAWARYALRAPLTCVRRRHGDWRVPAETTFADWVDGALPEPPTHGDLAYHLTTLFPPVRPRGYLEVRYFDTQPAGEWFAPLAVIEVLLQHIAEAERCAAPAIDRWEVAARCGTADPAIAAAAHDLLTLALNSRRLPDTVVAVVRRRRNDILAGGPA